MYESELFKAKVSLIKHLIQEELQQVRIRECNYSAV